MARKSANLTSPSVPRSSSKRAAPEKQTSSRQSKRAKVTTAKYSELESDDAPDDTQDVNASDFEDDSSKEPTSESSDDETGDDDVKPKKGAPRGRTAQRALPMHGKRADEKDLWKSGAKLPPGTQLIIKKPKARDAGQTPYTDSTIHPNTMLFLEDLAANNERQWLKCTCEDPCMQCPILYLCQLSYVTMAAGYHNHMWGFD
jgi:hypothetical protein